MNRFLPFAAVLIVGGCTMPQPVSDSIVTTLNRLGNTLIGELQTVEAIAQAATPPDQHGYDCAAAAIKVATSIQQVNNATIGKPVGAITIAEVASLYHPGSAQYKAATDTLLGGCVLKVRDVKGAAVSTAAEVIGSLALILPLAAAVP